MTWCSIRSFPGFSPTTSQRYSICAEPAITPRALQMQCDQLWCGHFPPGPDSGPVQPWHFPRPVQANGSSDGEEEADVHPEIRRGGEHGGGRYSSTCSVFQLYAHLCPSAVSSASLLPCRGLGGTLPLLHPLLLRHHRRLLPGQDGALLTHLPDAAGRASVFAAWSCDSEWCVKSKQTEPAMANVSCTKFLTIK